MKAIITIGVCYINLSTNDLPSPFIFPDAIIDYGNIRFYLLQYRLCAVFRRAPSFARRLLASRIRFDRARARVRANACRQAGGSSRNCYGRLYSSLYYIDNYESSSLLRFLRKAYRAARIMENSIKHFLRRRLTVALSSLRHERTHTTPLARSIRRALRPPPPPPRPRPFV